MKTSSIFRLTAAAAAACLVTVTAFAQQSQLMNYQGRVAVDGTNFDGTGRFKFALVSGDGAITFWSNDGTSSEGSEPSAAVSLAVNKGLYSVLLGDTSLANMTNPVPVSFFAEQTDVRLRVWFDDGTHSTQQLSPDQRIAPAGYAMMAGTVGERFHFDNAGGLLSVGGAEHEGSAPAGGAGTRLMWYPGKRAFRAGYVGGTQWDDDNIGLYSTAFGYNARALGDYGFAAGQNVLANTGAIAMGQFSNASGASSVALGYYANTFANRGAFVFSDRSVLDDDNPSTDESFKASVNHSFNVRATGGYWLFTNSAVTTGLRLSHVTLGNNAYGSFVWSDRSSDTAVAPTSPNQTIFRSSGGYWLYSDSGLTAGVTLAPGAGSWTTISDRNKKANFAAVDTRAVLRGVLKLPISTWNYKSQAESVRHIGPMAQDFRAAFGVGEDDLGISTVDPDGVALAAIQGLNEELHDRDAKITAQQEELAQQKTKLAAIEAQLQEQRKLIDTMWGKHPGKPVSSRRRN